MVEDGARRSGLRPRLGPDGGGPDLISALPEDPLLQVLRRLGCARAAARTSLLSRHWRGLWMRIAHFTFRQVALSSLLVALDSLFHADVVRLDIRVPEVAPELSPLREEHIVRVSSLLRAAADLSPVELRFHVRASTLWPCMTVYLPRFLRATSIDLHELNLVFTELPAGQYMFPALETLSLSACRADVHALVLQCPRLRVLRVTGCLHGEYKDITVRSATLHELFVENFDNWTGHIDFEVPNLNRLELEVSVEHELSVSVSAPVVEKVKWCTYSRTPAAGVGLWGLKRVILETESNALFLLMTCLRPHSFPHTELTLAREIEKQLVVTHFSVLNLHFRTIGHGFGASLFCLLRIHRIRAAIKCLKIILQTIRFKVTCPPNCPCDEPKNWRRQTLSLVNLEEVEIIGFEAEDYELDILRLIFKSAPMLKKMAVRLSDEVKTSNDWCKEIFDIFKAHPLVACSVDPSSELTDDSS